MRKSTSSKTPNGDQEVHAWRAEMLEAFDFNTDPAALALLDQACRALEDCHRYREMLDTEGHIISDRFGQKRAHPATLMLRDSRAAFARFIRTLNLDIQPPLPPGRPAGGKRAS